MDVDVDVGHGTWTGTGTGTLSLDIRAVSGSTEIRQQFLRIDAIKQICMIRL